MGFLESITANFANPALVVPGTLLILSPIIIHLINRMRYRRVRFAAMEFLLVSQQRNRRRVLIEQLLLLLLRILIVLAIMFLLARLLLQPDQASVFNQSKSHHLVLLDDSASMQDAWGETTAFEEGKKLVQRLVEEGAKRPGRQQFTLVLLSDLDKQVFQKRDINEDFALETEAKLKSFNPSNKSLSLVDGLQKSELYLNEDKATQRTIHVISDFRDGDWLNKQAVTDALLRLDQEKVRVNLVYAVPEQHENLAVTSLEGDLHVASTGLPVVMRTTVANFGKKVASGVEGVVFVDGKPVSVEVQNSLEDSLKWEKIEPGLPVTTEFSVTFTSPGWHNVRLEIDAKDDSLQVDDSRYLTVKVREADPVLVIDGDPNATAGFYVGAALSVGEDSGIVPIPRSVDALRREDLSVYSVIYLLNIPQLPPDALKPLRRYVEEGGGLVWYVGNAVNSAWYNTELYQGGGDLFPVPLSSAPVKLPPLAQTSESRSPDLKFEPHPLFDKLFAGDDNPFVSTIQISEYLPVQRKRNVDGETVEWLDDDQQRQDNVRTIARLRNNEPVIFEHQYGEGRVMTHLTTAGVQWNDWASTPAVYAIYQLEMQRQIARQSGIVRQRQVGEAVQQLVNSLQFSREVTIVAPHLKRPVTIQAAPVEAGKPVSDQPEGESTAETTGDVNNEALAVFNETDEPGIYVVNMKPTKENQAPLQTQFAYNVGTDQSDTALAEPESLKDSLGQEHEIQVQEYGKLDWLEAPDAEQDIRLVIIIALIVLMVLEQLLAYRLSYHTK